MTESKDPTAAAPEQGNAPPKKGGIVYVRKINKETGKMEDIPFWVDGDKVYSITKTDPATGEKLPVVKPVKEQDPK